MSNPYSLLVFDWDGTLMDSVARIVSCLRASVEELQLPGRAEQDYRNVIGLGLREALEGLYPGSDESVHQALSERYRYHYLTADPTPSELFAGAAETLQALADDGYLLAVATGKGRQGLNKVLEQTGLGPMFHATRCADESFSKPHPQMLEELMDVLGVEPDETLMIGDSEYDMLLAQNARTDAVGVTYGVHPPQRLQPHGPLTCIDDIRELRPWLTGREQRAAV